MNKYDFLDLNIIKNKVAAYAAILNSKEYIIDEDISFNPLIIKRKIKDTSSAIKIIQDGHYLSFDGIINPNELIDKASKSIILNPNELNNINSFLNHSDRIKKFFTLFDVDNPLRDYSDSINVNKKLINEIEKAIDISGNIKDNASEELKKINHEISSLEANIADKVRRFISANQSSLQELSVFERDGRVTFLIKNVDKNKFGGFNYGYSSSKLAQYIEPSIFVDINNKKIDLYNQKEEEIKRILMYLTYLVSENYSDIKNNFDSIVYLNVIFSKAQYGIDIDGILGNIDSDYLELINICHPLIDKDKVVSNSYNLKSPYKGIVISGSNTGGKTVSLKLIGLSVLLTYLAIPLKADSIKVPLFNDLYIDIDDNQSIESSLSTFSAHITNINNILINANEKSLILIDELISGTDPKEAQAISIAILKKIKSLKSRFVITTHFDDIKKYAYKEPEILLSSVGFDSELLIPTYHYYENSLGVSNALDIASRYFDDKDIINEAKKIINEKNSQTDDLLNKLANEISLNKQLNEELLRQKDEIEKLNKTLNSKINELENNKLKIKEEYEIKMSKEVDKVRSKANNYLNELKKTKNKEILEKIEKLDKEEEITELFNIGDNVSLKGNSQFGQIIDIKDDNVSVNINGLIIKTKMNNLKKALINRPLIKEYHHLRSNKNVKHEINLIGQRVDEALNHLDDYLDSAYGSNFTNVRIIHGNGTGALKKAIHEHLKKNKNISSYKLADFDNGGSAITIVEFKK